MSRADWYLGHDFAGEDAEQAAEALESDALDAIAAMTFAQKRNASYDWNFWSNANHPGRPRLTFRKWLVARVEAQLERKA